MKWTHHTNVRDGFEISFTTRRKTLWTAGYLRVQFGYDVWLISWGAPK